MVKVGKKEQPALETFLSPKDDEAGKKHQALVDSVKNKVRYLGRHFIFHVIEKLNLGADPRVSFRLCVEIPAQGQVNLREIVEGLV